VNATLPLLDAPLDAGAVGSTVRLVGYGDTETGPTTQRRAATAIIDAVAADTFDVAPAPGMSCRGDSGGPALLDAGGGEVVAGVTSYGDPACEVLGVYAAVPAHLAFVNAAIGDAAGAVPPGYDPAVDGDLCAGACETGADCPSGFECVEGLDGAQRCALPALGAGRFGPDCAGAACGEGETCARIPVAETCLCHAPCDPDQVPPGDDDGGCAVARGAAVRAAWLALWLLAVRVARRSRNSPRPRAAPRA
jgi:hypothetical protein